MGTREGVLGAVVGTVLTAVLAGGCGGEGQRPARETLRVTSAAFAEGERIPVRHTGEGEDVCPPLSWSEGPEGTKEYALICDDPDAPRDRPWVHMVVFGIPAGRTTLPEGGGGLSVWGRNDFGTTTWRGPMPPRGHGVHHYHFRVYALDVALAPSLPPGVDREALDEAMRGHVLAHGRLVGTYERE